MTNDPNIADKVLGLCAEIVCAAYYLDQHEAIPSFMSIQEEVVRLTDQVRGNRPVNTHMCFQDVRLIFLAALERAQDIVDEALTAD